MERSPIFRIAKEEWEASGGTRRENALSRRKSFRLEDTAASSNGRKQGDIIRCFQEVSLYLVKAISYMHAAMLSIANLFGGTLGNFLLLPHAMFRFWLFWFSDGGLTKIEGQKGPDVS